MTDLVMRATIWVALVCFVLAQLGNPRQRWCARLFALGAVVCAIHIAMAYGWRHGWSHAHAVSDAARITASVYGVAWGGGIYLNFAFLGLWVLEAAWWWRAPASYASRSRGLTVAVRAFFLLILVNATLVFTSGRSRALGAVLMAGLLVAWRDTVGRRRRG